MVKCGNCAAFNYDEARFCVHCGARIVAPAEPPPRKSTDTSILGSSTPPRKPVSGPAAFFTPASTATRKARSVSPLQTPPAREPPPAHSPASMGEALAQAATPAKGPPPTAARPAQAPPPAPAEVKKAAQPPPLPARVSSRPPSSLPFGDLLDDLEQRFHELTAEPRAGAGHVPSGAELGEVRTLFAQIAATHMGPVRDFMLECRLGEPSREWLDMVAPAVASLQKSAGEFGLAELAAALGSYLGALETARKTEAATLGSGVRNELSAAYAGLVTTMPDAFALEQERDRREPIIVQSLLRRLPEVRKVTLDRLYAAGLTSLSMYYVAKPRDLVEAAGILPSTAARIVDLFQRYKAEQSRLGPEAQRAEQRRQVERLTAKLRDQNRAYDQAARGWSRTDQENKRRIRDERNRTVLELQVVLAHAGAVALVQTLERLPFQGKLAELGRYLEQTASSPKG